jgi:hypothetical protein
VQRVSALCERRNEEAIVVFDPTARPVDAAPRVSVKIAEAGRSADQIIRELVDASPRAADLVVVTSDKPVYSYARTRGASALRVHQWTRLEREP